VQFNVMLLDVLPFSRHYNLLGAWTPFCLSETLVPNPRIRVVQFNVMLLDFVSTAVLVMLRLEAFLACLAFAHSALFHQAPSE
jgi:hypothetical protein